MAEKKPDDAVPVDEAALDKLEESEPAAAKQKAPAEHPGDAKD